MTLIKSISGIRGIIGASLDLKIVKKYVLAFSKISPNGTIILARDTRNSGENFISNTIAAFDTVDRLSINCGIIPTPTAQLLIEKNNYAGGIVFTASHNPSNWNGMKFINSNGVFINEEEFNQLENTANEIVSNEDNIKINMVDCSKQSIDAHISSVSNLSIINKTKIRNKKFKVAIDCTNGATSKALPLLLKELNCEIIKINSTFNEDFGRSPEPIPENLNDLSKLTINSNADIGFATDPDGDRLSIIDNKGKPLGEELTLSLAIYYFLKYFPKSRNKPIITNLSTSKLTEYISKKFNVPLIRTAVGEINVVNDMIKLNSLLGGEGNGGVILRECHLGRDSLVAAAMILNLLSNENKSISNIRKSLPYYYIQKSSVELISDNLDIFERVKKHFKNEVIIEIDGMKIEFNNGDWIHIRKSNTEPIIRIISESNSNSTAIKLIKDVKKILGKS